jgi:hypothetical protein
MTMGRRKGRGKFVTMESEGNNEFYSAQCKYENSGRDRGSKN